MVQKVLWMTPGVMVLFIHDTSGIKVCNIISIVSNVLLIFVIFFKDNQNSFSPLLVN